MPKGDERGPEGRDLMTGRAEGYCAGYDGPGYMNNNVGLQRGVGYGRGCRRGLGHGRGYGLRLRNRQQINSNFNNQKVSLEEEKKYLEGKVIQLKDELEAMKSRIEKLNTKDKD